MAGIQAVHDNTPERRIGTSLQATPAATAEASADSVRSEPAEAEP
ncbi:hypothetical protein [Thermomonas sp.]|nr:hypothetical protein [Thermomonas sp.]HRO62363.1 hypothetical protein [Thermomonas sp.]